jgi:hypothetical protein
MGTELAELAARVQRLEDLESVRSTWLDYCNRLDSFDYEALADVFTEDAEVEVDGLARALDGTYRGRRSIIGFYVGTETPPSGEPVGVMTGHLSTNMQIDLDGDQATTLAYFFEIVDDNLVLIGTYQHRMRRDPDRWRFAFLRISVRFRARIEASQPRGRSLQDILAKPV